MVSRFNILYSTVDKFFSFKFIFGVRSLVLFLLFATSVVETGGAPWLAKISANFEKNTIWP